MKAFAARDPASDGKILPRNDGKTGLEMMGKPAKMMGKSNLEYPITTYVVSTLTGSVYQMM